MSVTLRTRDGTPLQGWAMPLECGRFQPMEAFEPGATWMKFLHVRDNNGDIYDTIGWDPAAPGAWWTLNREVAITGWHELQAAWWDGRNARLFDSPADFLQHHGEGALIVDWNQDIDGIIGCATGYVCQSPALAVRLRQHVHAVTITAATATDAWRKR